MDVSEYVERDGSIIVEIRKAIYGLVEAAILWYDITTSAVQNSFSRQSQESWSTQVDHLYSCR
jgi:hypothetical protein